MQFSSSPLEELISHWYWRFVAWCLLACTAGIFVLELMILNSPPYWLGKSGWGGGGEGVGKNGRKPPPPPLLLLSAWLQLPRTLFRLSPSLFQVWIQDGTRLIKIRSLVTPLTKIRLHCRLGYWCWFKQGLPGFAYPAVYICICSTVCEMATLLSSWLKIHKI